MSPDELAAIRERDRRIRPTLTEAQADRRALLAHIDALEAAVEGLPVYRYVLPTDDETTPTRTHRPFDMLRRDAVLALLRGDTDES